MFAVIQTGGKQYKVTQNYELNVEKLEGELGSKFVFNHVLMIKDATGTVTVGAPVVSNASVEVEIVKQFRDDKIIIFKKKRRQNYRRKAGHRQSLTRIKVINITKN